MPREAECRSAREQFVGIHEIGQALVDGQPYALAGNTCSGATAIEDLLQQKVNGIGTLMAGRVVRCFCPELYAK